MSAHPLSHFNYCPQCGNKSWQNHGDRAKHCSECGLSYYHNVASAVACLVRDTNQHYLFVRRAYDPAKDTLDLPGGFVEPLETAEQAAYRELFEETGLMAKSAVYLGSRPNIYPYSGVNVYTSDLFFVMNVDSFEAARAQDDASELVISTLKDISAEDFGLLSIKQFITEIISQPEDFAMLYA